MTPGGPAIINSYYPDIRGRPVIRITFFLSIIIHAFIIIGFQGISFIKEPGGLRAYRVDLVRPPVEDTKNLKKDFLPGISQIHTKPPEPKEATISLDTTDPTYHPYTKSVKQKILNHWSYPESARRNCIQGDLMIKFRLDRQGNLLECKVTNSSGHDILDSCALNAVRSANPFPPFTKNIKVRYLNINASFAYMLNFEK